MRVAFTDKQNLDVVLRQLRLGYAEGVRVDADFAASTFTVNYDSTVADLTVYDNLFENWYYDIDIEEFVKKNDLISSLVEDKYYNVYKGGDLKLKHTLYAAPDAMNYPENKRMISIYNHNKQ